MIPLLIWFKCLEVTMVPHFYMHSVWDDKIPFLKVFVLPYLIWFPYIAFGLIYTGLHSKNDFYRLLAFLIGGMSVAYGIYMIFPNAQNLRPVITRNDFLSDLVKFVYLTDTPTNVCPSVHVINTAATEAALLHSKDFRSIRYGKSASLSLAILIILSTVFIKQHSVIDVLCGLLVSAVFYILLYVLPIVKAHTFPKMQFPASKEGGKRHETDSAYQ